MTDLDDNRVVRTFAELRAGGKKTLVPFITAGFPDLDTTEALLKDFESRSVRVCELGIPFSDPIADGPVIQNSYTEALAAGMDSQKAFALVRRYREAGGQLALVAMVSYSIVFRHGVETYLDKASGAGFDGLIIPDLPVDEAAAVEPLARAKNLANVMLIAPTTPPDRRITIATHCHGFAYMISVAGITGERDKLPDDTIRCVTELRKHTDVPICVGFGISRPEMVRTVCEVADGAIVGSAIVHRIADAKDTPRDRLVGQIGKFVGELLAPIL
jgi:tryptophan synthase alpha chain